MAALFCVFLLPQLATAQTPSEQDGIALWQRVQDRLLRESAWGRRQHDIAFFVPPEGLKGPAYESLQDALTAVENMTLGEHRFRLYPRLFDFVNREAAFEACEERLTDVGATGCVWLEEPDDEGDTYGGILRMRHVRGEDMFWVEATTTPGLIHEFGHLLGLPDLYDAMGHTPGILESAMGMVSSELKPFDVFSRSLLGLVIPRELPVNQERRISLRIDDVVLWRDGLTIMLLGTQVGADGEMAGLQLMQVDASAITHPMEKTPECLVCGNLNDALVQLVRHATLGQDPTQGEWTALDGRFRFRWRHMSDDRRIVGLIEASPRPAIGWDQPDQQELPWPLLIVAALLFIAIWGALSLVRWRRTSALRRSASD